MQQMMSDLRHFKLFAVIFAADINECDSSPCLNNGTIALTKSTVLTALVQRELGHMEKTFSDVRRFNLFVVTFLTRALHWLYKCMPGFDYGVLLDVLVH